MSRLASGLVYVDVEQGSPLLAAAYEGLAAAYTRRYGGDVGDKTAALWQHSPDEFAPPHGGFIVGLDDGQPVASGAFRRLDETTAELNRIWTARTHRQRGYAARTLEVLEERVWRAGYRRIYLTTGFLQDPAIALYQAAGYTVLPKLYPPVSEIPRQPFEKLRPHI